MYSTLSDSVSSKLHPGLIPALFDLLTCRRRLTIHPASSSGLQPPTCSSETPIFSPAQQQWIRQLISSQTSGASEGATPTDTASSTTTGTAVSVPSTSYSRAGIASGNIGEHSPALVNNLLLIIAN